MTKSFIERAQEELREIKEIFDACNTKFFLIFGTCLGAVREQNIIAWDKDIDIGVLDDTNKSKIHEMFIKHNFRFVLLDTRWHVAKRVYHTDIFWFSQRGDKIVCNETKGRWVFSAPVRFFNVLEKVKIGNDEYLAPRPTDEYLTLVYGSDWKKPNKTKGGVLAT